MDENKQCQWRNWSAIGPDNKRDQSNYKIEDYTCLYCGLALDKEKEVYCVLDSKTQTGRLAHKECIDNDPEWQNVEKEWEEILKGVL